MSKTHNYEPTCGLKLHITETDEGETLIACDKSGTCKSMLWQVMAALITEVKPKKVVEIMEHYKCEHGKLGGQSCMDKIARLMRERIKEEKHDSH